MASVRESRGRLFLDYRVDGKRQRTYVKLPDSPENRRYLKGVASKVDATLKTGGAVLPMLISLGIVEAETDVVADAAPMPPQPLKATVATSISPHFATFAEQWFNEFKVGWRKTYITTVRGILDQHLTPRFGTLMIGSVTRAQILEFRSHR